MQTILFQLIGWCRAIVIIGLLIASVEVSSVDASSNESDETSVTLPPPPRGIEWVRYVRSLGDALPPYGEDELRKIRSRWMSIVERVREIPASEREAFLAEAQETISNELARIASIVIDVTERNNTQRPQIDFNIPAGITRPLLVAIVNPSEQAVGVHLDSVEQDGLAMSGFSIRVGPNATAGIVLQIRAESGDYSHTLKFSTAKNVYSQPIRVHAKEQGNLTIEPQGGPLRVRIMTETGWPVSIPTALRYPGGTVNDPEPPFNSRGRAVTLDGVDYYIDTPVTLPVPCGDVNVLATRGPFHQTQLQHLNVGQSAETQITVNPRRWINPEEHGYIAGDVHVHVRRTDTWDGLLGRIARAEDLHVLEALVLANRMGPWALQDRFGDASRLQIAPGRIISSGQEYRNNRWGHVDLLGHSELITPLSTGPGFTPDPPLPDFPANAVTIRRARALGGVPVIAHGGNLGHEAVADLILGASSVMEILQFGDYTGLDLWYDLLSVGIRISPAAGTDYPVGNLPGTERVMVRPVGEGYAGWLRGLENGRSFVTNGPWIQLTVDDGEPGDLIHAIPGQILNITSHVANASSDSFDLQVLIGGEPIEGRLTTDNGKTTWRGQWTVTGPTWVAARTLPLGDKDGRLAHTAAIEVRVGDRRPHDRDATLRLRKRLMHLINIARREAQFATDEQKLSVINLFEQAVTRLDATR